MRRQPAAAAAAAQQGVILDPGGEGRWRILFRLWLWLCAVAGGCSGQVYHLSLAVDEGLPADTLVGDICSGLPAGEAHPGGFFLSEGSGESALLADFHVHPHTGIIRTARRLDREQRARYSFAAATLRGEVVQVDITITDVNDHAPRFSRASVRLNISELSPPGSAFRLPAAHDPDAASFGVQGYSLVGLPPPTIDAGTFFQLRYGQPPDTLLELTLLRRLDREEADTHRLLVEAWDGGSPRRTSGRPLRVEIHVLDENDNAPAFGQSEYVARVREDAPAGTSLCRLLATDADLGANGEVRYSLSRRQADPAAASYFAVDERSGLLRLRRPLDREARALHRLAVEARDGGAQPEVATARVAVEVLDVNDNRPAIHLLFLTEAVSEAAQPGEYVARVAVADPDAGAAAVALSLHGADGAFALRPASSGGHDGVYFLCVAGALDRERRDAYELRLVAVDSGSPPLASQRALHLRVADVNDQAPAFAQPRYRAAVSEAVVPGALVLCLNASDADEPGSRNAQVRYALAPGQVHGALFSLDPLSGALRTQAGLDHEREAALELLVLARDLGEPPLSASCLVSVAVEDANDNAPVFEHQVYNAILAEHSEGGGCLLQISQPLEGKLTVQQNTPPEVVKSDETIYGKLIEQRKHLGFLDMHATISNLGGHSKVKATDRDSGHFGHIRYFLYDGIRNDETSKAFQIDPSSGCIFVSQDIDKEKDPSAYRLLVKATDGGGLSAQAFVCIEVEDINDNHPVFDPMTYMASISIHTPPGTEIINVFATDKDSGIYGTLTYELIPGDLSSLFTVDTSTGIIYLISALSNVENNVLLTVSARDGSGLCSAVNAIVTIRILQSAVPPAIFERSSYAFSVSEDIPEGSIVGRVKAREPLNFQETLSYRISSGDPYGRFSIDSQYGIIHTEKPLDYETHYLTVLTVQSQLESSPVYGSTQIAIRVLDVNDNSPLFSTEYDSITVAHSTPPGTALYLAHADDKDSGLNGAIQYRIASHHSGVFTIDPMLGVMYLAKTLAANKRHHHHTVHIIAADHGIPPLSSLLILTVVIKDQPGYPALTFENLVYQVEVKESSSVGTTILQILARKLDRQQTPGEVLYFIEHNSDSASFRISSETGRIYLWSPLDYELKQSHNFKAFVTSSRDKSGQNASTSVIINVLDENDNCPVFLRDAYFFEVEESVLPQGVVGTISAVDKDSGKNGKLSYFLLSDGKYFKINPNTGEIINWVALDYEQQVHHQLLALVTDDGVPRCNATVIAYVTITDLNDNHPCFPQLPSGKELHIKVLEGQPVGSLVANIFAKDLDSGNNGRVLYSLTSGNSLGHFHIDSSGGEIRTTEVLWYNRRSNYRIVVTATDQGIPPLRGQAVISVEVISLTMMRSVSSQTRHFVIPENLRPAQVLASLRMASSKRKQQFRISEDDSDVPFEIDSSTGDLFLSKEIDYETASNYFFRVVVTDYVNNLPHNITVFLSIDIEDHNDHSPSFQNAFVVIGVEENVPVGTSVYTFHALDGDGSFLNSNLQYSVYKTDFTKNPFSIHPSHGTLITAVPLDREMTPSVLLTVSAADKAVNLTDGRQGLLTAQIVILDVNDNHPSFVSSPFSYIREDSERGSLVHRIIAQDQDQGRNGHVTYHLSNNEGHAFALDKTTGLLTTVFALDREFQEYYSLTVRAVDEGTPALSATQILTIMVLDVNDETPVFTKSLYEACVCENNDPGQVVVKTEAIDKDSGINSLLRYEILPQSGYEIFQMNSDTGDITTAISLDREIQEIFTFKVRVQDRGTPSLSSTASVVIRVLDENDHTPKFLLPISEIQILENQEPSIVSAILAVDRDAASNGTVQYQIIGGNDREYFALNKTSGELSTNCGLDREMISNFTLVIEGSDLGNPPRSAVTQLHVTVLDENDNSPLFARSHYRTSVREDLREGSAVLELLAVDADEGLNGEVIYSLTDDCLGAFSVNKVTGVVTTTKPLDRERAPQYVFRAVATDSGVLGPRSNSVSIIVHLEDVNDNSPFFVQNPVRAYVFLNTSVNHTITTIRASDADIGQNGAVTFTFVAPETMFRVDSNTGEVVLQEPVSHEGFISYLQIMASDQGVPARTATGLLAISSQAQQEIISFSHSQYEATVAENSETGTSVFTVAAYDHSLMGKNLKYTIISEHEDVFSIHPITGEITVKQSELLDFEVRKRVHFSIFTDNGLNSALCGVTIFIQDVNDNAPRFEQSCFKTSVWEGLLDNTYIIQIYATDIDSGLNGEIEYSVLSGNTNKTFLIDSEQGIISSNTILDREDISSYRLVVQAADRGTPRLSATSTVEITIVDVNDNAPFFLPLPLEVALPENAPLGFQVTQVMADDLDLGPPVRYSFVEDSNPGMKFAIDHYKGIITLVQALDFEEIAEFELLIKVSDSVHQTTARLLIVILDANDNPPVFTQDSYQVMIPELTSIEASILAVRATDRDSEYNGKISYRIISPSYTFSIDPLNGSLFLAKPFSDKNPVVQLLIEAHDNGSPPLTAATSVAVHIQDVNNYAPHFTMPAYILSVSENASVGERLLTFSAVDYDRTHENTYVEYTIIGGNDRNQFQVETFVLGPEAPDIMVGNLVLRSSLDRERCSSYQLVILASDCGNPPLSSSTTVSIAVLDINDNAPTFTSLEYHVHVHENTPIGSHIASVSAKDRDVGSNAEITYVIISGNDMGHFQLNGETGSLDLIKALNYEEIIKFSLTIQASDGGNGVRNVAFAVVFVNILDDNEYAPVFLFPSLDCGVPENVPPFSFVCMVSAFDFDTGPCGDLSYALQSSCLSGHDTSGDRDMFLIDPLTGDIHTKQALDFEQRHKYCFIAQAKDTSNLTATATIRITVEGTDEFDPLFNQDPYYFDFPEKNEAGQLVGKVTASDYDGGLDGIVCYTLLKQSPFFSVNHSSGAIFLTRTFDRKRSGMRRRGGILELLIKAHSPKLDSKSSTCTILVNISQTPERYAMVPAHTLSLSITASFIVLLALALSLAVLLVRHRRKDAAKSHGKKAMPYCSAMDLQLPNKKNNSEDSQRTPIAAANTLSTGSTMEWLCLVGMQERKNIGNPCRNSNSTTLGSAEETAEDEEIKRINEHPCWKSSGSALSDQGSFILDSELSKESDQLPPCQTGQTDVVATDQSVENVYIFNRGGGGDGKYCDTKYTCNETLPCTLQNMRIKERHIVMDLARDYIFTSGGHNSHFGSLATLIASDEDLIGSFNWDYLLSLELTFKPLAPVFNDLAKLKDESIKMHSFPMKKKSFIFPPRSITSVSQSGLKTVPSQMTAVLPDQAFKNNPVLPLIHKLRYPPLTMNSGFSPSLPLFAMQTSAASPVALHPSQRKMCPGGPPYELSPEEAVQK